jgi:hypothetical protein
VLLAAVLALALVTVPPAAGRLLALADLRLRRARLLVGALGLQVLVLSVVPDGPPALLRAGHLASYVLLGAFVWVNRGVPGLVVAGLGGALNALAIAANAGVMPASHEALRRAGMPAELGRFTNSAALEDARLAFLGDVFAVPAGLPLSGVFSAGDVLVALAAIYGVHATCGSRPGTALRRRLERRPAAAPAL